MDTEFIQPLLQDQSIDGAKFKLRLEVLISRLRAKISPHMGDANPIKPVRGRGYQLCMDVEIQ